MKEIHLTLIFILTSLLFTYECSHDNSDTEYNSTHPVARAMNEFSFKLRSKLPQTDNLVYSSFSIFNALAMLLPGASGNTRSQILEVLNIPKKLLTANGTANTDDKGSLDELNQANSTFKLANMAYVQTGSEIQVEYKEALLKHFLADLKEVDFSKDGEKIKNDINAFVSKATNGVIKNFLSQPLSKRTILALINAVYFKGTWKKTFNPNKTRPMDFKCLNGSVKPMSMMTSKDYYPITVSQDLSAMAVELPYSDDSYSMLVVLPLENSNITYLEGLLTASEIGKLMKNMRSRQVDLVLPKFELETTINDLKSHLEKLGIKDAFSPEAADFSGMTSAKKVSVSQVIHMAKVIVNEEGTEAAAATAIISTLSMNSGPIRFHCNRPFLAFLLDKETLTELFFLRVVKPTEK